MSEDIYSWSQEELQAALAAYHATPGNATVGQLRAAMDAARERVRKSKSEALGRFTCYCGVSIVLPLKPGPGNDFTADFPSDWYLGFDYDAPHIRCPEHNEFLR